MLPGARPHPKLRLWNPRWYADAGAAAAPVCVCRPWPREKVSHYPSFEALSSLLRDRQARWNAPSASVLSHVAVMAVGMCM